MARMDFRGEEYGRGLHSNRRGGAPPGATAFIVSGGMGASAPIFVILLDMCVNHSKTAKSHLPFT